MAHRKKKLTITQQLMQEVIASQKDRQHDLTRKQYIRDCKRFIRYCREQHDCKTMDECREIVQSYIEFLIEQKYSASTIHTYASAICAVFSIPLTEIKKPIRRTSEYTRGRRRKSIETYEDGISKRYAELLFFAERVAIRKSEYRNLRDSDYCIDSDGYFCVIVRRGKGGKRHLARIFPQSDAGKIRTYFERVGPDEKVFPPELFSASINLHACRARQAKRVYFYLLQRMKEDPEYAAELEKQMRTRFAEMYIDKRTGKPKRFPEKEIRGEYILRGHNRKKAIERGLPISYNKMAVMAVSLFVLAHGRCNTTVSHYLGI